MAFAGVKTVYLLRHGESEQNVSGLDEPDTVLTVRGTAQAASWRDEAAALDPAPELVLISPLRRTLRTACCAFERCAGARLRVCREARELYWHCAQCRGCCPDQGELAELLCELPRGDEIEGLEELDEPPDERRPWWDPAGEAVLAAAAGGPSVLAKRASECVAALPNAIGRQAENLSCVAVVTSWGVISQLTGVGPDNCDMVRCELTRKGRRGQSGEYNWKLEARDTVTAPYNRDEERD